MSNNYNDKTVVTIMSRHYMGQDENNNPIYMFNCDHVAVGVIDKKDNAFIDASGNVYPSITDPELTFSEFPHAYANAIALKDVKEIVKVRDKEGKEVKGMSLRDRISMYEYACKKLLYYVGQSNDGNLFAMSFDTTKLKADVEQMIIDGQIEYNQEDTDSEDTILDLSNEEDFDNGLRTLINNAISGVYSIDELKNIIESLYDGVEDIMDTIEALEYQSNAMKNKTSYSVEAQKGQKKKQEKRKEFTEAKEKKKTELVKPKEEKINGIDINALYEKVTKTLIAQDEPTRRVIVELARKELDVRKRKEGILLAGPTGVGKTKLMELIAEYIDRPFIKVDTTQLTIPGYVGKDIEEVLWDLYIKCDRNLDKAENAIIYFDEIDKKGSDKKSDVSGQGVLNVLLPFIEGSTYDAYPDSKRTEVKVKINTTNMTIILGGAFTDVYKNMKMNNEIGFGKEKTSEAVYREATPEDFVQYGQMTNEFMGRVVVVKLNDLSVEQLKQVLVESDQSAIKIQQDIFDKLGVKIKFTDEYLSAVAKKAYDKKTGARGLAGIVDQSTWRAFDEVCSNKGLYKQVTFNEETVEDNKQYKLTKNKK